MSRRPFSIFVGASHNEDIRHKFESVRWLDLSGERAHHIKFRSTCRVRSTRDGEVFGHRPCIVVSREGAKEVLNKVILVTIREAGDTPEMLPWTYVTPQVGDQPAMAIGFPHAHCNQLSNCEMEVLRVIAFGKTCGQIAAELRLSATTIITYRARVLEKLHMRDNEELTRYALEQQLVM